MKKLSTVFVLVLVLAGFVSSAGAQGQALTTLPELIVPQSGDLLYPVRPGATPPDFRVQIQNMRSYMIQGLNATCSGAEPDKRIRSGPGDLLAAEHSTGNSGDLAGLSRGGRCGGYHRWR